MTSIALYSLASVFLVSAISLVGIFAISINESALRKWILIFVSLAVGALFGDAIIHLIPEALHESTNTTLTSLLIIGGILIFFALEKFLHWHHSHGHEFKEEEHLDGTTKNAEENHIRPLGYLILISDGVHNFIDGIIIAASYFISIEVGIATTIAVILHEIPQEIGDFGVLLHSGFSKMKALMVNFISALFAVLGAALVLFIGEAGERLVVFAIPLAAGAFLYIAGSDLVPELHKTTKLSHSLLQFIAVCVGIAAMVALLFLE
ncbi:MAG: ZIP family metal transporter [Parcubacteria group bacterium]|nr:ZIP family metal transporter [Parcubacteria group bacterium]